MIFKNKPYRTLHVVDLNIDVILIVDIDIDIDKLRCFLLFQG